jgi:endonuclease/exonuclease/phosphatase family metal-dependent hydrolase
MVIANKPSTTTLESEGGEFLLTHQLTEYFPELSKHNSLKELEESELYKKLKPQIDLVIQGKEYNNNLSLSFERKNFYRAVAWNVERGICYEEILEELKENPLLKHADLLLLTETDSGMARSRNRNIARDLAVELKMNYYFVPAYINLCKGNGMEVDVEGASDDNELALHGNAILSRYPIKNLQSIPLKNCKDKMSGKEKRIGHQQALAATIEFPQGAVRAVCIHLDALSTQKQRQNQMISILERLKVEPNIPVLLGGDWNTSTYNSSHAFFAICGFWYRVFMGVGNVIANHYPYPDRYFEKGLFQSIKSFGYEYENCNELGAGTNHYAVDDIKKYKILRDWVPHWCFAFIKWALRSNGGKCSLKLDWFASKNLNVVKSNYNLQNNHVDAIAPKVVSGLHRGGKELSDHDPIIVDFIL